MEEETKIIGGITLTLFIASILCAFSLDFLSKYEKAKVNKPIIVPAKMMSGMPETKPYPKSWESSLQAGSFVLYTRKINSSAPLNPCLAKNINQKIIIESCV